MVRILLCIEVRMVRIFSDDETAMSDDLDPLFTVFGTTELERDIALMDRVKEKFAAQTDLALAELIGANKTVLSEIRSYAKAVANGQSYEGKQRTLTAFQRLRCFDKLGYAWARDALLAAFPTAYRELLLKSDNERIESRLGAEPEGPSVVPGHEHPSTAG